MTLVLPPDRLASLRRGALIESELRIWAAIGDARRSHLRQKDVGRTLCGKPCSAEGMTEVQALKAMGARKGCSSCAKRASPGERRCAAARAAQLIARAVHAT